MRRHTYAFYWVFKLLILGPALRVFMDRVYIVNSDKMVRGKAVLLAGNHPNSFLDGVLLAFFSFRRIWVIVRGDVFKHPVANRILRSMRLLPIFRARDANASVAKRGNQQTEADMLQLFKQKRAVLIFSEGSSYPEKKLRPLMRGTAKMIIEFPDKMHHPKDLMLQSVGLNYDRFFTRGGQFSFVFGNAVTKDELTDQPANDYSISDLKHVSTQIRADMSPVIIQWAEDEVDTQETILRMLSHDSHHGWRFIQRSNAYFMRTREALRRWKEADELVRTKAGAYHNLLQGRLENDLKVKPIQLSLRMLLAIIFYLPSAVGYAIYNPTWWLALNITKKRIKNLVFFDSIYFGIGMIFGLVSNLITFLLCVLFAPSWMVGVAIFLGLKLCYYIYLIFRPEYRHIKEKLFSKMTSEDVKKAKALRAELSEYFC